MPKGLPLPADGSMLQAFLALSRILTGVANLDAELGHQYLDRLSSTPFQPFVRQILERFQGLMKGATLADQVKQQILGDDALRLTVCQILLRLATSTSWSSVPMSPAPWLLSVWPNLVPECLFGEAVCRHPSRAIGWSHPR